MFNAISKSLSALLMSSILLTSCADKDKEAASALYSEGEAAVAAHNYAGALAVLDTLNARYPKQVDIRKAALRVRAQAMEGMAIDSIAAGDQALAQATVNLDAIRPSFRHVDSSVGLEGYYLPVGVSEKMLLSNGVQARVTDKGYFYIVANVQGRSIGLNSIEFCAGNESVSSSIISLSRVVRVEGSESASFNPEDLVGVGLWLVDHPSADKIVLIGSKAKVNVKMDSKLRKEIVDCYRFSEALQSHRTASIKREKFERMLATARDQIANLPAPDAESKD